MAKKSKTPLKKPPSGKEKLLEKAVKLQTVVAAPISDKPQDPKMALMMKVLNRILGEVGSDGKFSAPDKVSIPQDLMRLLDQLVNQGLFKSKQDAVIDLLWRGYGDYNDRVLSKTMVVKKVQGEDICPSCKHVNEGTNYCNQCGFLMMARYCGICGKAMIQQGHFCPTCQELVYEFTTIPPRDIQLYFDVTRKFLHDRA